MNGKKVIKFIIISAIAVIVLFLAVRKVYTMLTFKPPQMPPATVIVAKPIVKSVANDYYFTGNAMAVEEVKIRARVSGYLKDIHFDEGGYVKKDQLLFEIEPELYQANYDQALATLKAAQAEYQRADIDFNRIQQAVKTNAVSQQEFSAKQAQKDQAQAAVMAAQAMLDKAKLDLSYTKILSPIDGRISRRYADVGNLVGAGEFTVLADIVQTDPMYVYFYANEKFLQENLIADGIKNKVDLPFYVGLDNSPNYPFKGTITYIDNKVNPETGTIYIRGQVENPNNQIFSGMFARIKVSVGQIENAVLAHQKALGTDLSGKYLLVVNSENIVEHRAVSISDSVDAMSVIVSGLSPDDTYIVSGLQFVYPGAKVNPVFENQQPSMPQPK